MDDAFAANVARLAAHGVDEAGHLLVVWPMAVSGSADAGGSFLFTFGLLYGMLNKMQSLLNKQWTTMETMGSFSLHHFTVPVCFLDPRVLRFRDCSICYTIFHITNLVCLLRCDLAFWCFVCFSLMQEIKLTTT